MCQRKPKTFLDKFMAHVVRAFNTYKAAAAAGPVDPANARTMDGALLAVGALNDTLKQQVGGRGRALGCAGAWVMQCEVQRVASTGGCMSCACSECLEQRS